ncbi:hypothetical protein LOZ53_001158 [Ophidiomyces ophidiicola]|uniref:Uncharacterized protein n=1 Tax=Ophidiomyces ophidiicola TaxID=1387563 RepID=A0ACB8UTW4_9EURO|nr:hypothetical protein LOZ62_002171 [Ophidiomyces ophidiicola]KAI1966415.1 hypothetical protein LOZ56_005755 [Ophidiomyces ophidiicola]KAI1982242.1 hypothetical protein LOZ55_000018 [Ophidiomyces ophidiicola]KAI1982725.1 hypothetical protein LOZ54_005279 [Ophidiomyces ophidiicola]KAI1996130.1 hypothetical protein LOZ53_001158 [Ophidiomyces ophidiicola]
MRVASPDDFDQTTSFKNTPHVSPTMLAGLASRPFRSPAPSDRDVPDQCIHHPRSGCHSFLQFCREEKDLNDFLCWSATDGDEHWAEAADSRPVTPDSDMQQQIQGWRDDAIHRVNRETETRSRWTRIMKQRRKERKIILQQMAKQSGHIGRREQQEDVEDIKWCIQRLCERRLGEPMEEGRPTRHLRLRLAVQIDEAAALEGLVENMDSPTKYSIAIDI